MNPCKFITKNRQCAMYSRPLIIQGNDYTDNLCGCVRDRGRIKKWKCNNYLPVEAKETYAVVVEKAKLSEVK